MAPSKSSTTAGKQPGDPRVVVRNDGTDIKYLETQLYTDYCIWAGGKELLVHKAFLARIPHFTPKYLATTQFYEFDTRFTTYEVWWLMMHIYAASGKQLSVAQFKKSHPTTNGLDTHVRLIQIFKHYELDTMDIFTSLLTSCNNAGNMSSKDFVPYASDLEEAMISTFRGSRDSITPDHVKNALCELIKKHAVLLHSRTSFCKTLQKLDPKLRSRVALKGGCGNCAWLNNMEPVFHNGAK